MSNPSACTYLIKLPKNKYKSAIIQIRFTILQGAEAFLFYKKTRTIVKQYEEYEFYGASDDAEVTVVVLSKRAESDFKFEYWLEGE